MATRSYATALRSLLESHADIRVVAAVGDGRQAVKEASRLAPRVVLMDVAMPVLDGIRATRAILESSPQTAVIVLSDRDSRPLVQQAVQAGARDVLALQSLTATERDILRLVVNGKSNAEMAAALSLSPRTVETRRSRMMRKFDIEDLPALVTLFL